MRVVLIIEDDATVRRQIAEVLLGAGYGVCETHSGALVPAVPRLDAVLSDTALDVDRFTAPVVSIPELVDAADLLARVHRAVAAPGKRAA